MRFAEVIGALTLAADVSNGLAVEKGLRTVLVAMRRRATTVRCGSRWPSRIIRGRST